MSKKDKVAETPGLKDIRALFPPSAPSLPSPMANVSMKMPAFWPDAPEVWFTQADAQFMIRNVTVIKTKFYHAVAVPSQEVASQILDLIRAPLAGDPYGVLRECLITLYMLFQVSGIPSSLQGPEILTSDEQDAGPSSR